MGCDIHFYVEYQEYEMKQEVLFSTKEKSGAWGPWRVEYEPNPYFEPGEERDAFNQPSIIMRMYGDRDYDLFTRLANVRNYRSNIQPLSEPRGLPPDVCDDLLKLSNEWGIDGHSHSFFTLQELLDADWSMFAGSRGGGFQAVLSEMTRISTETCGGDLNRVRAVFWFDN